MEPVFPAFERLEMKERGGVSLCQSQPAWPSPFPVLQVVVTHITRFNYLKLSIFCLVVYQIIFTCKDVFSTARSGQALAKGSRQVGHLITCASCPDLENQQKGSRNGQPAIEKFA